MEQMKLFCVLANVIWDANRGCYQSNTKITFIKRHRVQGLREKQDFRVNIYYIYYRANLCLTVFIVIGFTAALRLNTELQTLQNALYNKKTNENN